MRGASFCLLFLLGCTVAVDDFERCEAPSFPVERAECRGDERDCTIECFDNFMGENRLSICLQGCGPRDSPCLICLSDITAECATRECEESYQNLSCCSLERCDGLNFECDECPTEITAFNECVTFVTSENAVCSGLIVDCFDEN
ncbi:MAG: hypothetical protein ACI9KE_000687 [Polyangiales bacterium]|jgi:hypothetical protein